MDTKLELQKSVLYLFKSVLPIETKTKCNYLDLLLEGVYIMPEARQYLDERLKGFCTREFGNNVVHYNRTALFKSFKDVDKSNVEQLLVDQLDHYLSVYTQTEEFSSKAINSSSVYVPVKSETYECEPFIFNATVISIITEEELIERVKALLSSGIALNSATQESLINIFKAYKDKSDINTIKNKEFLMHVCKELNLVPKKAEQLLRYCVYRMTLSPMLVNSARERKRLYTLVYSYTTIINRILRQYVEENGIEPIAQQFNRYRKLWIILKHAGYESATIINKARKLSNKLNRPHKLQVLDCINDKNIDIEDVKKELEKVTVFKKFSLLNAIYNAKSNDKMYVIRNGRTYSMTKEHTSKASFKIKNLIFNSIKKDIGKNIKGKRFYIPEGIMYAVPTSQKNFIDNIPMYTRYKMDKNSIIGIHWINSEDGRVDLDLHYTSKNIHIGWNSRFDSKENILYTGDLTDAPAPKGATEAFYIKDTLKDDFGMISVNNYSGNPDLFELFIGSDPEKKIYDRNGIMNAENLAFKFTGLSMNDDNEKCFGIVDSQEDSREFIFIDNSSGFDRVPAYSAQKEVMLSAIRSMAKNRLYLNELIEKLGGEVVLDKESADYDLSINSLVKDSFNFLFKADV
uniref:Uncharacterized protein n=1 Tax=virus sp. ctEQ64 TaxID=2825809 RepID=A0A8S5RL77_9VIRU|nr:MAG TPA: hypothetical protein [virus sp. ctEQ64]